MPKLANKKLWIATGVIATAVIVGAVVVNQSKRDQPQISQQETTTYQQQRLLRFSYEISNNSSSAIQSAKFSSYLPVAITSNQLNNATNSDRKFTEEKGDLGNRVAHFDVGLIPPYGKKIVKFVAQIDTAEKANQTELVDAEQYLKEEKYIELSHPKVSSLAQSLKGDSKQESAQRIYQWASTRIKYAGYVSEDKGALQAIQTFAGDCTEYMYTVIALARSLGIPARGIGGYVYEKDAVVSPSDYHNWAEVYFDGRWHIVDAQKKAFMEGSENYISMRILSDESVSLLGSSHRFSTAGNNLVVRMN